ncbi:sulfite exporter TauE/SafE family protein [Orrella sp. 11846]|uniref:sulfite exporter TauE/SafE family protein n=1 Tax=Orrella sp. 11846 TaxID=3409913 RepID=UPI003B594C95
MILSFLFTSLIVWFAAAIQTATGFGFSILAVPLLLLIHPPLVAVELNLIVSVFLCFVLIRHVRASVDRTLLLRLIPTSLLGAPLGLFILMWVEPAWFKLGTACLMLVFLGLLLRQFQINRTASRDRWVGWFAGVFTSAIGAGGIPLLVYFASSNLDKAKSRATAVAFFLVIYTVALIMQWLVPSDVQSEQNDLWWLGFAQLPIAALGVWLGHRLYARLDQRLFALCIRWILFTNCVVLMLDAWI